METGTGKTYVYLHGFKKFVIVVLSIAIKEGVVKNLEITYEHFQGLYGNTPADSSKVSAVRGFADSNNIQILVINIDFFAKDENIVNRPNDKLTGKQPIEFIQNVINRYKKKSRRKTESRLYFKLFCHAQKLL
ncbi:hypothetical protein AGMMS49953_10260 [Endomicrobiia bacterium]|nr:hypothetical protein AGMMS49953_10260 [Endomicrobiia bacterium]